MKRVVAWAVLLLSALFLLTTGGTYPGIASVEAHIIGQVIAYIVLGGWFIVALVRPEWRPSTPLFLPIALATAAYLLSFAFSQRPRLSLEPTLAGVGWAFGYLFLSRLLREPWFRTRVGALLVTFTVVVALGYIAQVAVEWIAWWNLIGFLAVPPLRPSFAGLWLGSPNLIATVLLLVAPLAVVLVAQSASRRWSAAALAVAALAAIFLSGSRGGWFATAAGLTVAVLIVLTAARWRTRIRSRLTGGRSRAAAVAALGLIGVLVATISPAVAQRLAAGGEGLRVDLWAAALNIFSKYPLTGGGPGTWVQLKLGATPEGAPNLVLPHAHNMYLQAAAELGLVGLACLALLALAIVRRLRAAARQGDPMSAQSAAVFVSLCAVAAQSVVDNLANLPLVILVASTLVAWVDGLARLTGTALTAQRRGWTRFEQGPGPAVAALVAMSLAVPVLVPVNIAALDDLAGNEAARRGDWAIAAVHYRSARANDPSFTLYGIHEAAALSRAGRLAEARTLLAEAADLDGTALVTVGVAALDSALANHDEAVDRAQGALRAAPQDAAVALNVGLIAEAAGERGLAIEAYEVAVAAEPWLLRDPFFTAASRADLIREIVIGARERSEPSAAALILAFAGDPRAAMDQLKNLPSDRVRDTYLAVATWLGGDREDALNQLDAQLARDPQDWVTALWAARIAYASELEATGARYAAWAVIVQADSARGRAMPRAVLRDPLDDPESTLPRNYPWAVYLRPASLSILVAPQVFIGVQ